MEPKPQYLHRIMDGVPFQDLETAITMAKIDYDRVLKANKKAKKI